MRDPAGRPGRPRTLKELGRAVGAGDRTLFRLFRSDLGMTFPQWRTQLRLHCALLLLADRAPVTAVAHACGWASVGAFIDSFRRTFGHTPGSQPVTDGERSQAPAGSGSPAFRRSRAAGVAKTAATTRTSTRIRALRSPKRSPR